MPSVHWLRKFIWLCGANFLWRKFFRLLPEMRCSESCLLQKRDKRWPQGLILHWSEVRISPLSRECEEIGQLLLKKQTFPGEFFAKNLIFWQKCGIFLHYEYLWNTLALWAAASAQSSTAQRGRVVMLSDGPLSRGLRSGSSEHTAAVKQAAPKSDFFAL